MNNKHLFKNYNLTNEEIEHVLQQMDAYINTKSYINQSIDEDLRQEIILKIFIVLSKNRKNLKNF